MDISIVYVSYNSKYYILQSLKTLIELKNDIESEMIIIDNASQDGTVTSLKNEYGDKITIIANKENLGFGRACNQGLKIAKGTYVLFINPDTVVQPSVVSNCIAFAQATDDLGVLGVQMLDGKNEFLPESKRGFPSPKAAFFKMSGLSKLFPKSDQINSYYQGKINRDVIAKVEVISGAFMFGEQAKLNAVNGFDEDYFMYGEDIDLSYRMTKAGFQNYYLGTEKIIHYKGKSSDKTDYTYVNHFYGAMSIFAKKHLKALSWIYLPLIFLAIRLRSLLSFTKRFFHKAMYPLAELLVFSGGMFLIKYLWATYRFEDINYYVTSNLSMYIWIYSFIWISSLWICLSYRFLDSFWNFIKGFVLGSGVLLGMYALLNIDQRPSRAIILFGAIWVFLIGLGLRWVIKRSSSNTINFNRLNDKGERLAIIGTQTEIEQFFDHHNVSEKFKEHTQLYTPSAIKNDQSFFTDHIHSIPKAIESGALTSIICFEKSTDLLNIYELTSLVKDFSVTLGIIGDSDGIFLDTMHIKNDRFEVQSIQPQIQFIENKILKRIVDFTFAFGLMIFKPFHSVNVSQLWEILMGKKTFVSYNQSDQRLYELPKIKCGIFEIGPFIADKSKVHNMNLKYAINYKVLHDIKFIVNAL